MVTNLDDDGLSYDDPVSVYVREMCAIPALSRAEEFDCIAHISAGDQMAESAKRRLVEANLFLVVSIAKRYRSDRSHLLDLIQRGNEGLMRAVQTLPASSQDSFSAHAKSHIEHAIEEAIAASGPITD